MALDGEHYLVLGLLILDADYNPSRQVCETNGTVSGVDMLTTRSVDNNNYALIHRIIILPRGSHCVNLYVTGTYLHFNLNQNPKWQLPADVD